jgi:hypothetical protein
LAPLELCGRRIGQLGYYHCPAIKLQLGEVGELGNF